MRAAMRGEDDDDADDARDEYVQPDSQASIHTRRFTLSPRVVDEKVESGMMVSLHLE